MRYLYICNATIDGIKKIELNFDENSKFEPVVNGGIITPFTIRRYDKEFITSNYQNNSISFFYNNGIVENFYLGCICTDMAILNNYIYIICEDSNTVVCFDIITKSIVEIIPCENSPYSLDVCSKNGKIIVSNIFSNSVNIIDIENKGLVESRPVGLYPTKVMWSIDGNYFLVCESYLGKSKGYLKAYSLENHKNIGTVQVGNTPMDICFDGAYYYVSNYFDGTISIVDIKTFKEVNILKVGGWIKNILIEGQYIYALDVKNNLIKKIDKCTGEEKNNKLIPMSGELTGMVIM